MSTVTCRRMLEFERWGCYWGCRVCICCMESGRVLHLGDAAFYLSDGRFSCDDLGLQCDC